ncbi:hypothetical protein [Corallococcus llansteffanensis]|nr:hypothetical protein [Corallococcus llansteffanensis]
MQLEGKRVVVIGAGSGIGRSVAVAATLFAMTNPFLTGTVLCVDGGGLLM